MAGHSHSANIAVRKGKQDAQRAKLFSKLSRYIIIAARNGGGDPDTNLRLRYAIDKARAVSMPKDNIERAVKKGTGDLEGVSYDEITYEGYGPGGVAVLVETLTDNRNRTNGEVRSIFEKGGGNMGTPGCVGYLFERKGLFLIDAKKFPDEDAVMTAALEAEADDFNREGDFYEVTCDPAKFLTVQAALQSAGIVAEEAEVKNLPKAFVDVDVETGKKVVRLIDNLDNNDDVQNVYTNANLTEEMADA
ncbi:MAG TPA: YebC/PmpR family DNA-binding transcriptional regulator [Fimbriiglobus sp.]|nr:YebC/PmpR family DNA-binding transcriptional regulator [Fimbriiglobus sp.]